MICQEQISKLQNRLSDLNRFLSIEIKEKEIAEL
jgi:hypothetical protein